MTKNGKGSSPRPISVDRQTYEDNWERVFSLSSAEREELEEVVARVKLQQDAKNFAKEFEDRGSI